MVILSLLGGAHERNIRHVVNSVILYRMKRLRDETEQFNAADLVNFATDHSVRPG